MALALIHQESKFNPNLQSQKGAKGAMQLMASTLRGMRQLYSSMIGPIGSVWNPNNNIRIGLTLLFHLLSDPAKDPDQRQYNEARMDYAFIAYNFGESGAKGVKTTAYQREVAVKYQLYHKLYSQQIKAALEPVRIVDVFQPPVYAPVILSR
jgi:soluble lytic murein transglycosylase-like protein